MSEDFKEKVFKILDEEIQNTKKCRTCCFAGTASFTEYDKVIIALKQLKNKLENI